MSHGNICTTAGANGTPLVAGTVRLTHALKKVGLPWAKAETIAQALVHIALSELPPHPPPEAHMKPANCVAR